MADVTVMGAGVFGLAVAWECARRGARVRVIDPAGPGAGASGNPVGALAPHVPDGWNALKALQFDALCAAPAFWADVEAAAGRGTGFARCGRLQPLVDDAAIARARQRAAEAARRWAGVGRWDLRRAADFGAAAPASPTGMVVHDTLTARVDPPRAIAALADAVRARGGRIVAGGRPAGPVIWATGAAGIEALSRGLGIVAGGAVKGQAARLAHAAPEAPLVMAPGLLIVPHADGTTGVGATAERDFVDPSGTDAMLEAVIARARALLPVLAGAAVLRRWAGLRPRAATGGPVLGPWPGREGHFVANGGFRLGFALAPAVAALMADLVLDGQDAIAAAFRPEAVLARARAGR